VSGARSAKYDTAKVLIDDTERSFLRGSVHESHHGHVALSASLKSSFAKLPAGDAKKLRKYRHPIVLGYHPTLDEVATPGLRHRFAASAT
jgi:hypothetical protein